MLPQEKKKRLSQKSSFLKFSFKFELKTNEKMKRLPF
jgi:hypothetical protein